MFQSIRHKTDGFSKYINLPDEKIYPNGLQKFHLSSGASSAPIKGNEAERIVRCKICGFPCDRERDVRAKRDTWAGIGVNINSDNTREVIGGCPCCGSYLYDEDYV